MTSGVGRVLMTASTWAHIRNFHLPYLREFQRLGWETRVGCAGIPDGARYVDGAVELPFQKWMFSPANLRAARILRDDIRERRYNLIITHTSLAAFFTRLAVKGLKERPKVINMVHGYLFDDATPALKRHLLLNAERLTAPETDLVLTMNQYDFKVAKKYRLGKQVVKIPGVGVDFSRLDRATEEDGTALRAAWGIPEGAFLVVYAAEFSRRKSQRVLIDAMAKLPENIVLALPGSGVLLEGCERRAEKLGLRNRVLFPGQVGDIAPWYRAADAAASASRSEGLPFNVMEAMHMGLPVVASAVKGHVDLISDGGTGLLYPYGDAAVCAEKIARLVGLRETLSGRAREDVAQFALRAVMPEVMTLFFSALEDMEGNPHES